jgi:PTH1 family peptidyl-tRNA hydrolase
VWLLVGLGNPGPKYAQNRHNIGFMVIDELASRWRADAWRSKFGAELAQADVKRQKAIFAKPQKYMNVSGEPVQQIMAFYQVEPKDLVVVHDEIDIELGRLKLKVGGGHGGHNGIRSIMQQLGGAQDFARVRCGVGRPQGRGPDVADHVLSDFSKAERTEAEILIKEAADAVELIVEKGPLLAMNRFNVREKPE